MRKSLRDSVKEIIHKVGVTSILVTHDQEEAFDIADKVVIFNRSASMYHSQTSSPSVVINIRWLVLRALVWSAAEQSPAQPQRSCCQQHRHLRLFSQPDYVDISCVRAEQGSAQLLATNGAVTCKHTAVFVDFGH